MGIAMNKPVLFDYFRSSASYRVRIALNLKGVEYEAVSVDLLHGKQKEAEYRTQNPQGLVPMLDVDGHRITQSLAIIGYLEATRPEPPLLPTDPADAAHVRTLALIVACDIHPLNNLRILKYLGGPLGQEEEARNAWYRHWVAEGLAALEAQAAPRAGRFLFEDRLTLADVCLVPQLFNARRFEVPLEDYPTLLRADGQAKLIEAFAAAHPERVSR
jgi:maleylacetoacetate isomerase